MTTWALAAAPGKRHDRAMSLREQARETRRRTKKMRKLNRELARRVAAGRVDPEEARAMRVLVDGESSVREMGLGMIRLVKESPEQFGPEHHDLARAAEEYLRELERSEELLSQCIPDN